MQDFKAFKLTFTAFDFRIFPRKKDPYSHQKKDLYLYTKKTCVHTKSTLAPDELSTEAIFLNWECALGYANERSAIFFQKKNFQKKLGTFPPLFAIFFQKKIANIPTIAGNFVGPGNVRSGMHRAVWVCACECVCVFWVMGVCV